MCAITWSPSREFSKVPGGLGEGCRGEAETGPSQMHCGKITCF